MKKMVMKFVLMTIVAAVPTMTFAMTDADCEMVGESVGSSLRRGVGMMQRWKNRYSNALKQKKLDESLRIAAAKGDVKKLEALLASGADVNAAMENGATALHCAARHGHVEAVQFLITRGALVNILLGVILPVGDEILIDYRTEEECEMDFVGCTPLHLAAQFGHVEVAEALLAGGADVEARVYDHFRPLHVAAEFGQAAVARVLIKHRALVNIPAVKALQVTPLHLAAQNGHDEVVRVLLDNKADPNAQTFFWHKTPLSLAAEFGHASTAKVLIEGGAAVNARTLGRNSALHFAAKNGHDDVAQVLLAHEADPYATNMFCTNPRVLARLYRQQRVVNVINQHVATT